MTLQIKKLLVFILSFLIIFSNLQLFQMAGGGKTIITNASNYQKDENIYILDLDNPAGYKFTNDKSMLLKEGKIYCEKNKTFDIRGEFNLGDSYGLTGGPLEFLMVLESGQVSIGTRLVSTVSVNDTGIWFHITKDKIEVTIGGTPLKETFLHKLELGKELAYKIEAMADSTILYIDNTEVARVKQDHNDNFTFLASSTKNVRTPRSGLFKISVDKLEGYFKNIKYSNNTISQSFKERDLWEVDYSNWFATDDLGRVTPMYEDVGKKKEDKLVGLFYFMTGAGHREGKNVDITKEYLERGIDGLKAFLPTTHGGYWAEPYFGYYSNTDTWVMRKHAQMFESAGIDFIFLDISNDETFDDSVLTLFDTFLQIRKEGGNTPQIAFMCGDMPHTLVHSLNVIYPLVYQKDEYKELFFKWEGKPLILGNNDKPGGDVWTVSEETIRAYKEDRFWSSMTKEDKAYYESGQYEKDLATFTVRKSWAWQALKYENDKDYAGYWDYLDYTPQAAGRSFKGVVEQMSVSIACLAHLGIGRSSLDSNPNYGNGLEDFEFTLETSKLGLHFAQQFEEALKVDPRVIMITGWNEWVAGRQTNTFPDMKTGHTNTPYYHFVDQFNPEFSRDAEPMKLRDGVGYGDNYYYQMVSFIRRFKGMDPITKPLGKTISFNEKISSDNYQKDVDKKIISQWDDVKPVFTDHITDTAFRNYYSNNMEFTYINTSGRNDIMYSKVSQDKDYVYFLAKTAHDIITVDDETFMNLYIDIDQKHESGWEGYDFAINRSRDDKTLSVEIFKDNSWDFEEIGRADYFIGTDSITIRLSKDLLGLDEDEISFDFKWADNSTQTGDIMEFMDLGDVAPNDRFNFRYSSTGHTLKASFNPLYILLPVVGILLLGLVVLIIVKRKDAKK